MNEGQLVRLLKFIFVKAGVPRSSLFARWSVFAYPFWADNGKKQVGFKIMAYRGVNSSRERVMKAMLAHGLNCFVSGVGVPTTGLGAVGSGVGTVAGKWGGLRDAFDVDVGAVQLSTVLESSDSTPADIANAIISSGRLLMYGILRVDKCSGGHKLRLRVCRDSRGRADLRDADWAAARIDDFENLGGIHQYIAWVNGIVFDGGTAIGNYKRWAVA